MRTNRSSWFRMLGIIPRGSAMPPEPPTDGFRVSDPAVVARFLQLRSLINDRVLARAERIAPERYQVLPTRRLVSTLTAHVRTGFARPDGGEVWPVFFLT